MHEGEAIKLDKLIESSKKEATIQVVGGKNGGHGPTGRK